MKVYLEGEKKTDFDTEGETSPDAVTTEYHNSMLLFLVYSYIPMMVI